MRLAPGILIVAIVFHTSLIAQITNAPTFGQVIALGGTPSDVVLDETRQQIYLVNSTKNRVDIFSIATQSVVRSIGVGNGPLAAALSMDARYLYVTNSRSSTLSVIDLGAGLQVIQTVTLPAVPEGVAVGLDGRALIGTLGTNSLLIFDQTLTGGQQLTAVATPPPPSTPAPLPPQTTTRPQTTFNSKMIRTPDGQFIVGLTNPGNNGANTYLFVYEVASGTILRSRQVAGQSTVLSISPDGSRFMAGYTMYDTASLSVIAQQNNANAPFPFTATFSTAQNVGGSVFAPSGTLIYSAFNVAPFTGTNPPPQANASTLLINDARNLGIQLGIRMPESIVSKMVISSDGNDIWSLSASGMIYLPISTLYNYPILQPETTRVFLASDPCHRGISSASLNVGNLGKGKVTFAITSTHSSLAMQASSGVAPSTITFTMDPGRTGVTRQSGTNLTTGGGDQILGIPVDINLSSNEAINIPPVVRVYMNQRDIDQRGIIYPVPTTPNNSPASGANPNFTGGNEGLQDILLDEPRNRVYLSNSGYNRLEVFDTLNKVFLSPIIVGQLPHQMAMSSDGNTLYVGNTGGEVISIVDLTQDPPAMTGYVNFPPLPRQAGGTNAALLNPRSLAYGNFGLQFIMSDGSQWKLSTANTSTVRPADTITPVRFTVPTTMIATPDGGSILTLAGGGVGYIYNGLTDSYSSAQNLLAGSTTTATAVTGYFGALGAAVNSAYFLQSGEVLDPSLNVIAGNQNASATQRNVAALWPYDQSNYLSFTTSFRTSITATSSDEIRPTLLMTNISSGSVTLVGVAAEQPRYTFFGTTRTNIPARHMVADSKGNAYLITLSGMTVIPVTLNSTPQPQIATARGVINSTDGSTNFKPGSFVTVIGAGLAAPATAQVLPAPTVLGGSCVTFNDVSLPLFQTADGQIQGQIPATVVTGTNVVVVRSLANGTFSNSVLATVQPSGTN
jgi:YVTN family beta-propeller protein